MLDGMEKDRNYNLQKIIVNETSKYTHDFQLIYATSGIDTEYEGTNLTVGKYFNPDSRSLVIL
jgi:hypothetical protein